MAAVINSHKIAKSYKAVLHDDTLVGTVEDLLAPMIKDRWVRQTEEMGEEDITLELLLRFMRRELQIMTQVADETKQKEWKKDASDSKRRGFQRQKDTREEQESKGARRKTYQVSRRQGYSSSDSEDARQQRKTYQVKTAGKGGKEKQQPQSRGAKPKQSNTATAAPQKKDFKQMPWDKCLICGKDTHVTTGCLVSKPYSFMIELCKEYGLCHNCFSRHNSARCGRKPRCTIPNCSQTPAHCTRLHKPSGRPSTADDL